MPHRPRECACAARLRPRAAVELSVFHSAAAERVRRKSRGRSWIYLSLFFLDISRPSLNFSDHENATECETEARTPSPGSGMLERIRRNGREYVACAMTDKVASASSLAKSLAERVNPPVVLRLPGTDRVRVVSNLKYSEVGKPHLLMDVYIPPDLEPQDLRPVVVFIHGGAGPENAPKNWGMFQSWGRLIAAAGMVAAAFTHRFSPPPQSQLAEAAADVDMCHQLSASQRAVPSRQCRSHRRLRLVVGRRIAECAAHEAATVGALRARRFMPCWICSSTLPPGMRRRCNPSRASPRSRLCPKMLAA